jgi:TetR/AcrR family transcriptional regulator
MPGIPERLIAAGRRLHQRGRTPTVAAVAGEAGLSRSTVYRAAGSQAGLLRLLEIEPDPGARERILEQAMELVSEFGLNRLSMDELAVRAGVSRANLYRLFPGKEALFRELVRAYSPMEIIGETIDSLGAEPPEVVMPALARAIAGFVAGRPGLVRTLFYEVTGLAPETQEAARYAVGRGLGSLLGYLSRQMELGRLRPMHPMLALQAFAGPLMVNAITRELASRQLGVEIDPEAAAVTLADLWIRAMKPEEEKP